MGINKFAIPLYPFFKMLDLFFYNYSTVKCGSFNSKIHFKFHIYIDLFREVFHISFHSFKYLMLNALLRKWGRAFFIGFGIDLVSKHEVLN